jgi:hypothetical protein
MKNGGSLPDILAEVKKNPAPAPFESLIRVISEKKSASSPVLMI